MEGLLAGLLRDLESRCLILQRLLSALPEEPDTAAHALESYQTLELARRDAAGLALEPDLADPSLAGNYLHLFERLAERVRLIEWMVIPFLARYNKGDRFLTAMARRLIDETKLPVRLPVVGGFSAQYYWTFPPYSVIAVPAGENTSLLGLSDLCHELGHMLLADNAAELVGGFLARLTAHVRNEQVHMAAQQRPPDYIADYLSHFRRWEDDWLLEFVSDMVATYLAGPPFGFQHVRLCAGLAQSAYRPGLGEWAEHPADYARLEGIAAVLELLGDAQGAATVRHLWGEYTAISQEAEPPDYSLCYPVLLIQDLAREVVRGCRALGIRTYQSAPNGGIVQHMAQAWEVFQQAPSEYAKFEEDQVERLKTETGRT
jgi:hypothetical protein